MDSISFSDTRANLKSVMDKVVADRAPVAITRARGQEGVVMVSASEWASIEGDALSVTLAGQCAGAAEQHR